jgi:hypothetical protein
MSKNRRVGSRAGSVTVFFQGGLGNQLFQLAAGLDAAEGDQSRLVLDFTLLSTSGTVRSPEVLDLLNQNNFRAIHLQRKLYIFPLRILRSLLLRIKYFRNLAGLLGIITDGKVSDTSLLDRGRCRSGRAILLGYFQSSNSAEKLRNIMAEVLKLELLTDAGDCSVDYLFIHMRRGDYLKYRDIYGVISENDLIRIGNIAAQGLSLERVYLASEDREAANRVQGSLEIENGVSELVSSQAKGVDLLKLMVNAKALVLANSSLSWWGAFLNQKNSVVYYPNPWFQSLDFPDFILESWVPFQVNWE